MLGKRLNEVNNIMNDSKGISEEIIRKLSSNGYRYYYDDKTPSFKPKSVNCYDEVCHGSNERKSKINALMHEKVLIGSPDFMDKWSSIVFKMHNLMKEEFMALAGCSEREADYWIEANVDFNHVKEHIATDGKRYLSVDPKIGNKYVGFTASLKESESND